MISLRNLTLRRGSKVVLDGASAVLNPGEKIGLVGRNGAGKSSLFALLQGQLHEDSGELLLPRHWRSAAVAQEMPETTQDATAFVIEGDTRLAAARAALAAAEASGDGLALAEAHGACLDAGSHDAHARAQALLLGLGFDAPQLERPVNSFSGGWRMRLQLARALICPSDLLLLDEPTNHLDLDALVWLESWLKRYSGTLLLISHDREFLDAVTGVTLHLEAGQLKRYGAAYSRFESMRAEQLTLQQSGYERQQERIAHLQSFIDRFKAKATKARQAQSRVKALQRMEKLVPVLAEAEFNFEFDQAGTLPNPMLSLRDAGFGYRSADGHATPIVRGVTRSVMAGQRIGILGANGQGKSTFVKTVARTLDLLEGQRSDGKGLRIGYYAQQEMELLRADDTALAHLLRLARETEAAGALVGQARREQDLRNFLGRFQFGGELAQQRVGNMSGGEKARLVLCLMVWQRPNLLLLDEPTNHLDLTTREALALALNGFEGTVLLVSHDRALLRAVCDEFWLVSHGGIEDFEGDLDDYQRHLLDLAKQRREAWSKPDKAEKADKTAKADQAASPDSLPAAEQRRLDAQRRQQLAARLQPHKKQREALERELARLQDEQQALQAQLQRPAQPAPELAAASQRLGSVEQAIETAEERWLEVAQQIEALEQAD